MICQLLHGWQKWFSELISVKKITGGAWGMCREGDMS